MQGVLFVHEPGKCLSHMAFADLSTAKVLSLCCKVTDLCIAQPARCVAAGQQGCVGRDNSGFPRALRGQSDVLVRGVRPGGCVVPREGQGAVPVPGDDALPRRCGRLRREGDAAFDGRHFSA